MTLLLNKIFIDSFKYFNGKELTIPQALKVTDLLLIDLEVDCTDSKTYESYINNFLELNKLLINFICLTEEEAVYFDNTKMEKLITLTESKRLKNLTALKAKRKAVYEKYEPELIELISQLKVPQPLAA